MNARRAKLTVAFNGDIELFGRLAEFPEVESVFGKVTNDMTGGGRPSFTVANIGVPHLKRCIAEAHRHGIGFIYLFNATCQANQELTRSYNHRLCAFIDELVQAGVDAFVVAAPYMLDLIKKRHPNIKVTISTFSLVTSPKKARMWQEMGADRIMFGSDLNRNFKMIRKIRQAVSCELEIFANNICINQCPFPVNHASAMAHSSSSANGNRGFFLDYCAYHCVKKRLSEPAEFIRGRFIRPEDVDFYSELGVDVFKVAGRIRSTDWIVRAVRAFSARRYDGNLADLIEYPYLQGSGDRLLADPKRWLLRPDQVNLEVLELLRNVGERSGIVSIDNRALDGFLDYFKTHDCENSICGVDCHYCQNVATRVVKLDVDQATAHCRDLQKITDMLSDGRAFTVGSPLTRAAAFFVRLFSPRGNNFRQKIPHGSDCPMPACTK